MWKISETRWLNPLAITTVHDFGQEICVWCPDGDREPLRFTGEERQAVLDFLARHSQHVRAGLDDDWPFDEDPSRR